MGTGASAFLCVRNGGALHEGNRTQMLPHSPADFFICSVILTKGETQFGGLLRAMRCGVRRMTLLVSAVILLAGCAVAPTSQFTDESGSQLALAAVGLVGVPYRYGGEEPDTGLDCSGLVRFAARTAWGLTLPRQTEAMSRFGVEVAPAQLRAGDLVFFNTLGKAFSHVGVYLGDDRFVHAPTQRGVVRVERLSSSYWRSRFDGARRLAAPADALHRSDAGRPDAKWSFRRNGNTRETP